MCFEEVIRLLQGTVQQMEDILNTIRGGGNIDAALWQARAVLDGVTDEMTKE